MNRKFSLPLIAAAIGGVICIGVGAAVVRPPEPVASPPVSEPYQPRYEGATF